MRVGEAKLFARVAQRSDAVDLAAGRRGGRRGRSGAWLERTKCRQKCVEDRRDGDWIDRQSVAIVNSERPGELQSVADGRGTVPGVPTLVVAEYTK